MMAEHSRGSYTGQQYPAVACRTRQCQLEKETVSLQSPTAQYNILEHHI